MNWVAILLGLALGLVYGGFIGAFDLWLLNRTWAKVNPKGNIKRQKRKVVAVYWLHLGIYGVALFIVCHHTSVLLGAGLGMLIVQKTFVVKTIKAGKGVKK